VKKSSGFAVLLSLATAAALMVPASSAAATVVTYRVNTTADTVDAAPGDGKCADATGRCSLRAAMMEAERHPTQTTTVVLPAGRYKLTRPPILGVGDLSADGALYNIGNTTVEGAGARKTIIDANHLDRAFFNLGGVSVLGMTPPPQPHLTLENLTITNGTMNATTPQPAVAGGGAIANGGWLTLRRVTLTHNQASVGGALMDDELGRHDLGELTHTYLEMYDSTISDNVAEDEGGGMRIDGSALIVNSTITGNTILATCCTASSSNGGVDGEGGGIDARGEGEVDIINSTIVGNHAVIGGGGVNIANGYTGDTSPIPAILPGPMTLRNTIIADNTSNRGPANCKNTGAELISRGDNIASDASCFLTASGDKPNVDPLLSPFGDHGGPTDTFNLLAHSPAIGAATNCPKDDQRGVPRPPRCDIGSVERTETAHSRTRRRKVR
jgi:CSLREA domain-containing protein